NPASIEEVRFPIRIIDWSLDYYNEKGEDKLKSPIILQDKNGPCPLIALINSLVIGYEVSLKKIATNNMGITHDNDQKLNGLRGFKELLFQMEANNGFIELKKLLEQLGDLILIYNNEIHADDQDEIDKILTNLPLLHTGLNVDPNLLKGNFVKDDLASQLFELFGLKFKHGWVIDPIDNEDIKWNVSARHVHSDSQDHVPESARSHSHTPESEQDNYGKLVELFDKLQTFDKIQDYLLIDDEQGLEKLEKLQNQRLISKWLELNKTQLTSIGLKKLNNELHDEEVVIFFRNNHFNTLFKKGDMDMYLLITDTAFNNKSNKIVWQSFNSVSGKDDLFFTGDFLPILELDANINDEGYNDSDYLLLKQLQEEEDERLAVQMQHAFSKKS
ncbi:uncharacterized protein RJT21DRAFT_69619, partial [Scheffersomyces amazonensis]|uniref:uncharacterized protein n=1 Tax=Scheffersomyces amazonensis TaxID=1078765 RepID=UPI00315CA091